MFDACVTRPVSRVVPAGALLAFLCFACWAASAPARAQTADATGDLPRQLSELLAKLPKGTEVGLVVAETGTGEVLFAHRPDALLAPASVQKLFVTAAALERFGPEFEYQTRAYLQDDELRVVGAGDPGFGDERLAERYGRSPNHVFEEWAAALAARGVTSLRGIILDDSVFDQQVRHPDWPIDQADRWYQAPVGGLNLNDNCLEVSIVVRNQKIELNLQPDIPADMIENKLTRGRKQRAIIKRAPDAEMFELAGSVTRSATLDPACVRQPTAFFGQALRRALEQRGIKVHGEVVQRRLTADETPAASLLATHTTGLPDVLWRANTFSQNMFAECLVKSLAAYEPDGRRSGTPGSWGAGRSVLQNTLAGIGVDVRTAVVHDGSGLSHADRATAAQLVRLLVVMRKHRHADVFLASLTEPGQPGSMHSRYDEPWLRGRLRGKTGTLKDVRALAGYLAAPDGRSLTFALLVNGRSDPSFPAQVCKVLLDANAVPVAGAKR